MYTVAVIKLWHDIVFLAVHINLHVHVVHELYYAVVRVAN